MNAAIHLMRTAARSGVDLCLANPGTTEMPLVAALDDVPEVRAVLCLFEGVCTGAADGYGRMLGRPALTLLHLGPGFANGIANLHNARRARSPVVNLIGDQASWHLAYDAPLTSDIVGLAQPVSNWLRTSETGESLGEDVAAAIRAATGPPGRVATLILPADHQAEPVTQVPPPPLRSAQNTPKNDFDSRHTQAIARSLHEAGAGALLLLGASALSERGQRAAGRIARATGARLRVETFPARWERGGTIPCIERLGYFPEQATPTLADARPLVLAGAVDPVAFFGYPGQPSRLGPEAPPTCLATPEQDATAALEALADELGARLDPAPAAPAAGQPPTGGALTAAGLGAALARALPEDAIVVDEAATSGLPFYAASQSGPRHSLLTLTGGAIGQGLPCATGAALACPDRKLIALQADGSAMYTFQALWTQAREALDVLTILCSNRAYRILQIELARAGIRQPGERSLGLTQLDRPELDWCALARGCGVDASRVETLEEFDRALRDALSLRGPRLIEAVL